MPAPPRPMTELRKGDWPPVHNPPPAPAPPMPMKRANFIGAPEFYNLQCACAILNQAFGYNNYLVGSSLVRRDFRDVDIRCILDDEEFDRLFPGHPKNPSLDAFWSIICAAISEWLAKRTGLAIDFQIQRRTEANAENDGRRNCLGLFIDPKRDANKSTE